MLMTLPLRQTTQSMLMILKSFLRNPNAIVYLALELSSKCHQEKVYTQLIHLGYMTSWVIHGIIASFPDSWHYVLEVAKRNQTLEGINAWIAMDSPKIQPCKKSWIGSNLAFTKIQGLPITELEGLWKWSGNELSRWIPWGSRNLTTHGNWWKRSLR